MKITSTMRIVKCLLTGKLRSFRVLRNLFEANAEAGDSVNLGLEDLGKDVEPERNIRKLNSAD
jgi:hypothetical protein